MMLAKLIWCADMNETFINHYLNQRLSFPRCSAFSTLHVLIFLSLFSWFHLLFIPISSPNRGSYNFIPSSSLWSFSPSLGHSMCVTIRHLMRSSIIAGKLFVQCLPTGRTFERGMHIMQNTKQRRGRGRRRHCAMCVCVLVFAADRRNIKPRKI